MRNPMPPRVAAVLCVALALSVAAAEKAQAGPPAETAVHCGSLLDTAAGVMRGESTIIVEGDRVREVRPGGSDRVALAAAAKAKGAPFQYVELAGSTCLPGLIDAHTHLTMEFGPTSYTDQFRLNPADYAIRSTAYARRTLLAGFTTVRNLGDRDDESIALRNAVNAGLVPGPRIFTAGRPIGSTGGHADFTDGYRLDLEGDPGPAVGIINGPEDAWKAVRQHYKEGADLIKIMPSGGVLDESRSGDNPQLTVAEIEAVVAAAHDYGFTVAAHAHGAEAIRRAVLGGVDSIEHGTFADDADIALMKARGTWFVPTIIAGVFVAEKAAVPGYYPPQVAAKAAAIGPKILATAGRVYRAGVKNRLRHRRGRVPARRERPRVRAHGEGRHAAVVRDPGRDDARGRVAAAAGQPRRHRPRRVRRRHRRAGGSGRRRHQAAERRLRDEGRDGLQAGRPPRGVARPGPNGNFASRRLVLLIRGPNRIQGPGLARRKGRRPGAGH